MHCNFSLKCNGKALSRPMYGFLGLNFERSLFLNCMSQLVHSWHVRSLQGKPSSCKVLFALHPRIRSYGCFSSTVDFTVLRTAWKFPCRSRREQHYSLSFIDKPTESLPSFQSMYPWCLNSNTLSSLCSLRDNGKLHAV